MMLSIKILHTKSTGAGAAAGEGEAVGEGAMGDQQKQHVHCFSTVVRRQYLHKPCPAQELSMAAVHNLQRAEVVDETTWV
jgi:hypothetical protein